MHKQGAASDRLAKRYMLMLETIVKARAKEARKEGPPKVLFLREVLATLSTDITTRIAELVSAPPWMRAASKRLRIHARARACKRCCCCTYSTGHCFVATRPAQCVSVRTS